MNDESKTVGELRNAVVEALNDIERLRVEESDKAEAHLAKAQGIESAQVLLEKHARAMGIIE